MNDLAQMTEYVFAHGVAKVVIGLFFVAIGCLAMRALYRMPWHDGRGVSEDQFAKGAILVLGVVFMFLYLGIEFPSAIADVYSPEGGALRRLAEERLRMLAEKAK